MSETPTSVPESEIEPFRLDGYLRKYATVNPDEDMLAMVGPARVGKTVLTSLVFNEAAEKKEYLGIERYRVIEGAQYLHDTLGLMLKGIWPPGNRPTDSSQPVRIMLEFRRNMLRKKKVYFLVNDFSGEYISSQTPESRPPDGDLLTSSNPTYFLLTANRGNLAFMTYAKAYAFLVEPQANMVDMDFKYMTLVSKLCEVKTQQKEGEMHVPVAVVVTKWDLVGKEGAAITPRAWIQKKLPKFWTTLESCVKNRSEMIECFRSHVLTRSANGEKPAPDVEGGKLKVEGIEDFIEWVRDKI